MSCTGMTRYYRYQFHQLRSSNPTKSPTYIDNVTKKHPTVDQIFVETYRCMVLQKIHNIAF